MKKIIVCLGIVSLVLGMNACKSEKGKEEACAPASLNPNGDSELALLMRDMAKLSEDNAIALREGKELVPYNGEFTAMKKAERTMKDFDETFFQGMLRLKAGVANNWYNPLGELPPESATTKLPFSAIQRRHAFTKK